MSRDVFQKVMKFGGTSMGSAASIRDGVVPAIQKAVAIGQFPVVVVSAMSGITSLLLESTQKAQEGKLARAQGLIKEIEHKHLELIADLFLEKLMRNQQISFLNQELETLRKILKTIFLTGELSTRMQDAVLAIGENISARILSNLLIKNACPAIYLNLEKIISKRISIESPSYWTKIEKAFSIRLAKVPQGFVPILPGFFGAITNGILNSVGRGYSDFCASLVGVAIRAHEIENWTDVDGILTAHPSIVPKAKILSRISFDEMAELARFGAKVLHPFSVAPASLANIPIRMKNTFNHTAYGTLISSDSYYSKLVFKSIAYKKGITIIRITTPKMLMAYGFMAKLSNLFAEHKISIDLIATSEVSVSLSVDEPLIRLKSLLRNLKKLGEVDVQNDQAILSIVGVELRKSPAVCGEILRVLAKNKISINMISMGNALINLSLVLHAEKAEKAIQVLHQDFINF
ncbi:MAG: aspartate kinase III, aspartate kinase [Candidatus Peregrinibacteria bacterium GW2011_GWF2_39_17]|nr:MAG: aspartate kinase III, aspartate kinase [Candidatus Peregrinibacteria bacterium GW2011_GWF2_39_17]HCW32266.1 hypothetical protein [Candidatus Peregrinibacteria bacterium]